MRLIYTKCLYQMFKNIVENIRNFELFNIQVNNMCSRFKTIFFTLEEQLNLKTLPKSI